MEEDDGPLFMDSGWLISEMEGGGGGGGGGGGETLLLRVSRFSFWIAKLSESFASRIV